MGAPGITITVKVADTVIGSGLSQQNGSFIINIPAQAEGTAIDITASDGTQSNVLRVVVSPAPLPATKVNYKVYVNGTELYSDVGFFEYQGVLVGPLRALGESMELQVEWNSENQQIIFSSATDTLVMTINSTTFTFNGVEDLLLIQPTIIDNRTLVPIRPIIEAFGGKLTIDKGMDECFIATASFGSKFEPSVVLLRQFRDEYLLKNLLGRAFVKFYYKNSPPIAEFIADSEPLKAIVRGILTPIVGAVYLLFHPLLIYPLILLMLFCWAASIKKRLINNP